MSELWVVMPVYNEEQCVERVIMEWLPALHAESNSFTICILNDGSKDGTLTILRGLAESYPELRIVNKPNSGHGQTCAEGYRLALAEGAAWVLQIDSDGQCDPVYFADFWRKRKDHPVIYGYRNKREDGLKRFLVSRVVSLVTLLGSGIWVRDANVPYRLMSAEVLKSSVSDIPSDFHLANVKLAAVQQALYGIHWINIVFRNRIGGTPSIKSFSFFKQGWKLFKQLQGSKTALALGYSQKQ